MLNYYTSRHTVLFKILAAPNPYNSFQTNAVRTPVNTTAAHLLYKLDMLEDLFSCESLHKYIAVNLFFLRPVSHLLATSDANRYSNQVYRIPLHFLSLLQTQYFLSSNKFTIELISQNWAITHS